MIRLCTFLCLLSTAPMVIGANDYFEQKSLDTATALRESVRKDSGAYAIVEELTTEIGPRLAGTPADDKAVAWAKAKFEALGYDKVWLQPVSFTMWERGHERGSITTPFAQPLVLTALGGSIGTDGQPIEAPIVEFASLDALKAATDGSLTGKIAYISAKTERFRDGRGYGLTVGARGNGAVEAAKKGARALIIRSIGTSSHRFAHTGIMRYVDEIKKIPAVAVSAPDADQLSRLLTRGKTVKVKLDIAAGSTRIHTSHNVIGEIRGRSKPNEYVVIGGHLDSWDQGTGAIDDGAGVAITMAAGAQIGKLKHAPQRSIRVIAWANEEQGLLGAREYAKGDNKFVDAHQIAAESDFGAGRIYGLRSGVQDNVWQAIEAIGEVLKPLGIEVEKNAGGPGPDVGPLVMLGVPWAQLAQDGTDYFDYHHTPNDTLDKIEAAALDQQSAAYAVFAYLAADSKIDFGRVKPPAAPPPANTNSNSKRN